MKSKYENFKETLLSFSNGQLSSEQGKELLGLWRTLADADYVEMESLHTKIDKFHADVEQLEESGQAEEKVIPIDHRHFRRL